MKNIEEKDLYTGFSYFNTEGAKVTIGTIYREDGKCILKSNKWRSTYKADLHNIASLIRRGYYKPISSLEITVNSFFI